MSDALEIDHSKNLKMNFESDFLLCSPVLSTVAMFEAQIVYKTSDVL